MADLQIDDRQSYRRPDSLHYYHEGTAMDYIPIDIAQTHLPIPETGYAFHSLYNGNIGGMTVNIPKLGGSLIFTYRYGQLNRIVQQNTWKGIDLVANTWRVADVQSYREAISYDPNGNIMSYKRNGDAAPARTSVPAGAGVAMQLSPAWTTWCISTFPIKTNWIM